MMLGREFIQVMLTFDEDYGRAGSIIAEFENIGNYIAADDFAKCRQRIMTYREHLLAGGYIRAGLIMSRHAKKYVKSVSC